MNAEVEDRPETGWWSLGWGWLWWLGILLLLYVLSTGPLLRMMRSKRIKAGSRAERIVATVYWPFDWAVKTKTLGKPLGMYWHLWAPELYDSHGDRKQNPTGVRGSAVAGIRSRSQ